MRKKRRSSKTIYIAIAIAGLLSLLGMALIGANSAIHTAERTAERTQQYLREQCISYQDIIAADRVKSLVRLTEQVQELTDRDRLKGRERSNEGLAEYAQQQRISCVLVLNDALEPVYSYGVDMDWSDLYTNESVSDVMQYPEKIFARRLTRDGVVYDVAAAARTVEPGMVFCVRRQSSAVIASYYASIESLLAGYETLLNERIYTYITDGEKIIGSSDNDQWNLPVDSVPLITALEQADSGSCLTKLDCGGTFFGMRGMYQKYSLYVFLPADFVFAQTENMLISAFGVYAVAVMVVVLLLVRLGQDRKRRELAYQKQLEKEVERATAADQAKTHFLRSMSHDIRTPVIVTNGGKQAVYESFQILLNEGDEVIIPTPYWTSYPEAVKLAGGVPVTVFAGADRNFEPSIEDIEAARTEHTKAIIVNTPNNPTGAVWKPETVKAIAQWAIEHHVWVISDEIYEHLNYDGAKTTYIGAAVPEVRSQLLVLNGVAKTYAMPGWRVGWMIAPVDVAKAASKLQGHMTSNVNNISQRAAIEAVSGSLDAVYEMRAAFDKRRQTIVAALNDIEGVNCPTPTGAFYAFADVTALLNKPFGTNKTTFANTSELAAALLDEGHVAAVPGEAFGAPGYLRFSYALADDDLVEGMRRMKRWVED